MNLENNESFEENDQGQGNNANASFDDDLVIMEEDAGLIGGDFFESFDSQEEQNDQYEEDEEQEDALTAFNNIGNANQEEGNQQQQRKSAFDSEEGNSAFAEGKETATDNLPPNVDAMAEALRAAGYNITPPNVESADAVENANLQRFNSDLKDVEGYLSLNDDKKIEFQVRDVIAKKYTERGYADRLNSAEFEDEVQNEIMDINRSETSREHYLNTINSRAQGFAENLKKNIEKIEISRENRRLDEVKENQSNLRNSFDAIYSTGKAFGVNVTSEQVREAYDDVVTGRFAQTVNSNPDLVAQFALFTKLQDSVNANLGGKTYGNGVKDAFDTINSGGHKSKSPIPGAISRSTAQGGGAKGLAAWRTPSYQEESGEPAPSTPKKQQYVAGRRDF